MASDRLWIMMVVAAFSTLLILAYFVVSPLASKSGTVTQLENGLQKAVGKFDTLKEESKQELLTEQNAGT